MIANMVTKRKEKLGDFWRLVRPFLPALFIMAAIFYFSAQPGDDSSETSEFVGMHVFTTVNMVFGLGWTMEKIAELSVVADGVLREVAHFLEFMCLGLALFHGFRKTVEPQGQILYRWTLPSLVISVLYAVSDEIHQLFVPDRAAQLEDVLCNSAGAAAGVLICTLYYLIRSKQSAWIGNR